MLPGFDLSGQGGGYRCANEMNKGDPVGPPLIVYLE